jgi:uncharacterized membrane protein
LIISGVLLDGLVSIANEAFSVKDTTTEEGVHQPTSSLRSGGPGSLVSWDSLGRQGRKFTGLGPLPADIEAITHQPAEEPIRIYAGLQSAADAEARAALAVQDLERAGGFQRNNLLVVTTTGSGWVDPASVDTFEYLSGGNSATVAIQYSYLPSWISYLVDQEKAREAGRSLFDAVYDCWSKLPATARPRLFVAGEVWAPSVRPRLAANTTCATGPPAHCSLDHPTLNTLFREFSDHRDAGQPGGPVTRTGGRSDSPTTPAPEPHPPASPGKAPGFSTSCTRPTRSCGGARTSSSTNQTGSANHPAATCSTESRGCRS